MLRRALTIGLVLVLGLASRGDEPQMKPAQKPPYERLLQGADAQRAAELEKRIGELASQDDYTRAIKLAKELLALRTRVQRADHYQVVNAKAFLDALQKVAALPADKRAGWRKAVDGWTAANQFVSQGQSAKAELLGAVTGSGPNISCGDSGG